MYDEELNYDNMTDEEYLEHHGTKGMKWGVRRNQRKLEKALKKYNKAEESLKKAKGSAGIKDNRHRNDYYNVNPSLNGDRRMSNAELKARANRLELEKRYLNALPKVPTTRSKVESFLDTTVKYLGYVDKGYNTYKTVDKIIRDVSSRTSSSTS